MVLGHKKESASHMTRIGAGCSVPAMNAIAGAIGGGLALLITYPLCLLSVRTQFKKHEASSCEIENTASSVSLSGQTEGQNLLILLRKFEQKLLKLLCAIQKWYAGISSAILAQLVIQYAYYYTYIYVRRLFAKTPRGQFSSILIDIASSTIAGLCGATASQPLWVLNTKKSIDTGAHSTISVLTETLKKQGVGVLFNGLIPSYILVLNPVISYSVFEALKRYLLSSKLTEDSTLPMKCVAQLSGTEIFFLSAVGKIASTLITYPYMVARNVMQYGKHEANKPDDSVSSTASNCSQKHVYEPESVDGKSITLISAWKHIIFMHGYKGLYRGLESKIVQSVMNHSLLFLFQDYICNFLTGLLRPLQ
ncbi:Tyrosine-sulfated glycopeptide receptor 1 [Perkinsela sp. CCAP 1560/4]|nr:Tyrosine-sulfated glycopeptide receptor 1 [Perkinsela sp. CCAP 1560/4]|eukprot:KNH07856.1 Tyrosine-sulfated glycopeptide receptor 1 [Perkinsela sp. CCAP 1560/4]